MPVRLSRCCPLCTRPTRLVGFVHCQFTETTVHGKICRPTRTLYSNSAATTICSYSLMMCAQQPANTDLQLLVCSLAEKNQQIQIYSYWFAPQRKKPANTDLQLLVCPLEEKTSKYRFTVIGLLLSGKPANTDLQLLVCSLAEKTSKYRFTVIGLPLSEKNPANTDVQLLVYPLAEKTQQIQIYSYWFAPQRKKPANTDLQLLVCSLAENQQTRVTQLWRVVHSICSTLPSYITSGFHRVGKLSLFLYTEILLCEKICLSTRTKNSV